MTTFDIKSNSHASAMAVETLTLSRMTAWRRLSVCTTMLATTSRVPVPRLELNSRYR